MAEAKVWSFTRPVNLCHISFKVNKVVLPLRLTELYFVNYPFKKTHILITLVMLVPSTAPFVVVSDMATGGRSWDARSTGNVLAKQSWVMIGTHSSVGYRIRFSANPLLQHIYSELVARATRASSYYAFQKLSNRIQCCPIFLALVA